MKNYVLTYDLVFKNIVNIQSFYDFWKANKQNVFEQYFDKPDVYCQPLANLSDKPRATLR